MLRHKVAILNLGIAFLAGIAVGRFVEPPAFAQPLPVRSVEACGVEFASAVGEKDGVFFDMVKVTAYVTNFDRRPITDLDARRAIAEPHCEQGEYAPTSP